jgi:hypothetical protein
MKIHEDKMLEFQDGNESIEWDWCVDSLKYKRK